MNHDDRIAHAQRAHALMTEALGLLALAGVMDRKAEPPKRDLYNHTVGSCAEAAVKAAADAAAALERQRPTIRIAVGGGVRTFSHDGFTPNDRIDPDDLARILRDHATPKAKR